MKSLDKSASIRPISKSRTLCRRACLLLLLTPPYSLPLLGLDRCDESVTAQIKLESQHPWRPPFGLERVGQSLTAIVEVTSEDRPYREYWLTAFLDGKEIDRQVFNLSGHFSSGKSPYTGKATFAVYPDELVLFAKCKFQGEPAELARIKVPSPGFEAEVIVKPDSVINPVDLGTILPPNDWFLLPPGQKGSLELAAISRASDMAGGRVSVWYESAPSNKITSDLALQRNRKASIKVALPLVSGTRNRDVLHVSIVDGAGKDIWHRQIQTMLVSNPPKLPEFGATETKVRFDAPISVRDPRTGALSSMSYDTAWPAHLKDVVISLPNGSRYVFWRGSCYIPFWAGKYNTGMSYEWAETTPPPDGFTDSVEPLMDKELRYGRVEVLESTASRVHVRWTYQSTDFTYKVWGDSPVEDYFFYPDGFGTRVLNLTSAPEAKYEVQEMIILAPQAAFPYQVLHPKMVDILFIDGVKREIAFPPDGTPGSSPGTFSRQGVGEPRETPAVYRVRLHRDDAATAISFNPIDTHLPKYLFSPFYDRGVMVTPAYWGSHWPLARGNTTGWTIDDRIYLTPSHNSVLSWGLDNQTPSFATTLRTLDTLGRSKTMIAQRYVWLIGMTDAPDSRVLEWAQSFKNPPSLELKGAHLDPESSYVSERRAIRLVVEDSTVSITVKPTVRCVNPVFELGGAPKSLKSVKAGNRPLAVKEYAWDGHTLWIDGNFDEATSLTLEFAKSQ
jgi:hypothetical protein